jgi:hypothetical protein
MKLRGREDCDLFFHNLNHKILIFAWQEQVSRDPNEYKSPTIFILNSDCNG